MPIVHNLSHWGTLDPAERSRRGARLHGGASTEQSLWRSAAKECAESALEAILEFGGIRPVYRMIYQFDSIDLKRAQQNFILSRSRRVVSAYVNGAD